MAWGTSPDLREVQLYLFHIEVYRYEKEKLRKASWHGLAADLHIYLVFLQVVTIKQETVQEDSSQDVENGTVPLVSDCSTTGDDVSVYKMKYDEYE
jgi:hypothetical protein